MTITNDFSRCRRMLARLAVGLALVLFAAPAWADGPELALQPEGASRGAVSRHGAMESLGVPRWHEFGQRGRGMTVAILDSSFTGYRQLRGTTLPAQLTTRSFRRDGKLEVRSNTHGAQCAEVIHAIAPEAKLLLANWEPDSPRSFLEALAWALNNGARIVSCSVIVPSWSDGEGGGAVHRELARLIGKGNGEEDALFIASAGNTAQRHWAGHFKASDSGWHAWAPGQITNRLTPWGAGERISVDLVSPAGGKYELVVRDMDTRTEVGRGRRIASKDRFAVTVRFVPKEGRTYGVRVREIEGSRNGFHLSVLGGNLQRATRAGSIPFPGDGQRCLAVGAVDEDGKRQVYSSCGPNSATPKPELVAVVPFHINRRKEPFTGTSAAAPQTAGAAALYWARHPSLAANQVRATLLNSAVHLDGDKGHSWDTGFGLVRLPDVRIAPRAVEPSANE